MTTVLERIDRMEQELRRLDRELSDLRTELAHDDAPAPETASLRVVAPTPAPAPTSRPPAPRTPVPVPPIVAPRKPPFWSREVMMPRLEAADLLGARGLALAGGVVTLLGVVFFFALAASNGWIGPVERVLLGAAASSIVFAAGVFAHARYGRLYASVAAAGAGIAGGYATLLFAAARYDLVPPLAALALAAAIAAVAVALSLSWSSEIVAGLRAHRRDVRAGVRHSRRSRNSHRHGLRGARLPRRRGRRRPPPLERPTHRRGRRQRAAACRARPR